MAPIRPALVSLLAASALVLAACGDDDDDKKSEAGGGDQLTKAELIQQADAICKKGDAEIDAAFQKEFKGATEEPSPKEIQPLFESTVVPNIERQINAVAVLKPPEDLQDDWDAFITSARSGLAGTKEAAKTPEGLEKTFSDEGDPFKDAEAKAKALGLKECAAD